MSDRVGERCQDNSMTMFDYTTLPTLLKVGRLDATLQNAHGKNMALYSLALNGEVD